VWAYQKSHYLSNRIYLDYADLFEAVKQSWNQLQPERLHKLTHTRWLMQVD